MDAKAQPGYLLINRLASQFVFGRVDPCKQLIAHMQSLIAAENARQSTLHNSLQPAYGN